jgi:hypothetical protein
LKKPQDDEQFSLELTIEEVDGLEREINDFRILTRRADIYPFDTVAGELLGKSFALARAAILLIEQGFPDEAFGLCRSLYEAAIYLRYVTKDSECMHERATAFLKFGRDSKAFWAQLLKSSGSLTAEEIEEIDQYITENEIPDDPKIITRPWSGVWKLIEKISVESHPLDAPSSSKELRDKQRAFAYTDTSSYVHCTQPSLNHYALDWKELISIGRPSRGAAGNASKACLAIQVHLREIVRYCLFGMKVVSLEEMMGR